MRSFALQLLLICCLLTSKFSLFAITVRLVRLLLLELQVLQSALVNMRQMRITKHSYLCEVLNNKNKIVLVGEHVYNYNININILFTSWYTVLVYYTRYHSILLHSQLLVFTIIIVHYYFKFFIVNFNFTQNLLLCQNIENNMHILYKAQHLEHLLLVPVAKKVSALGKPWGLGIQEMQISIEPHSGCTVLLYPLFIISLLDSSWSSSIITHRFLDILLCCQHNFVYKDKFVND